MMESSHIAAANDDRLAEHGAVEVAGSEPPGSVFYRLWLADIRGLQEALRQDAAALEEIAEWCKAQRQEVSSDDE